MDPKQPEAIASKLPSDLLETSADEEQRPFGFDFERRAGEGVDVESRESQSQSHEQGNQELLIQFDVFKADTHDVLQPRRFSAGTGGYPEDEHEDRGKVSLDQQSDTAVGSDEQNPRSAGVGDEEGSPQKRLRFESDDTGFGTYGAAVDDDDDEIEDDEHKNRYILQPQELSIHVGAEADVSFDLLGNENRYFPQTQNAKAGVQQETPELLFEPDEETDHVATADDQNNYFRHTEPSPPEADLGVEEEAPELQFEPDVAVDHDSDGDTNRYFRQPQNFAPEADLVSAEESPELQLEPNTTKIYDRNGDENNHYIRQSQNFAPEADLGSAEESPELQFEPDDNENQYFRHSQPSVPEADLNAEFPAQRLNDNDDDEVNDDDEEEEDDQYVPESQRVSYDAEDEPPEIQFQPEDDKINGRYFLQSQNSGEEVDQGAAALHFASAEKAAYGDEDDDDNDNNDDDNIYTPRLYNTGQADVDEETPALQPQPDDTLYAAASHDDDDDYDNGDDDGSSFTPDLRIADQTEVEEETHELQSPPGDTLYAAASHDDDDVDDCGVGGGGGDDDDDDDGSSFTPQLRIAGQAEVEEETHELQSQPTLYADASPHHHDGDNNGDGSRYISSGDQDLGAEHEQHLYDAAAASSATLADDDNDVYSDEHRRNMAEYSAGHDQETPALQYGVYDAAISADEDDYLGSPIKGAEAQFKLETHVPAAFEGDAGKRLVDTLRSVDPESGLDDKQRYVENVYQHSTHEHAEYGTNDGDHGNDSYLKASGNDAKQADYEEPYEPQHSQSYEASVGANYDDNIRYTSRSDESQPTVGYNQQQRSYYEERYDADDNDSGIIGRIAVEAEGTQEDEDNPRLLIKGILSEGDIDERYTENPYDEENEDEEDDTDDAIDIRDNTNVEDQFIEFEDTSFVEAAVGGVMDDAGLNGENKDSKDEGVGEELGATGGPTAAGADEGGDNDGVQVPARASTSRVRFADEEDPHLYPDENANNDDYHIIPGASIQTSFDSHDHNHTEAGDKSLDVLLLEEICEEAASMTIKEALIHSLKPNVRAGLTTAHLKLSESEVLALEEYCENFVGGLIKDLLKRSSLMDLSSKAKKPVVKASVIKSTAKHLSAMEVQQMKVYCDHFVHNVIAESIIDSSMIVAKQQHQAEVVKELLHMFQNSEELQEYFTNLTTDIVRTALLNVTAKDDLDEDNPGREQQIEASEYEPTESVEQGSYHGNGFEFENQEDDFDFDSSHSFGFPVHDDGSPEYRRSRSQDSWGSEDEDEMGTNVSGRSQGMTERTPPGHTTFEFDEEWAESVIGNIEPTSDGEKRQKIFMRELEFDDRANVGGTELLAPVFLAVAEENEDDTEFEGLRRKTQSIEDLCDYIEEEKEPPRKRSSSLTQPKRKPHSKKQRPNSFQKQMEELKREEINEDIPHADIEPDEEYPPISPEPPSSPITEDDQQFVAYDDERYRWHTIRVNNREKVLDLKLIEPYMKVITHGGVHMPSRAVIVVIAACYLPDKTMRNYDFLMEQLFFYLISTLELLATTDEYYLVYFNGGTTQNNQPALPWMKRFYQHVEGGLKKNMINMFIVHPNFWLKTVVRFAKAFVGTNFWSKLQFIKSLDELSTKIPVEFIYVPDEVIR